MTTSTEKRRALVELAAEHDFPILEDVPYRELRYHGETPPSLGELAGDARVITLGSLSKVLSPGLRIGYAICDPNTATALAALAEGTYLSPAPLCQAVAARCLAAGAVGAHIERVRDFLRPRHDAAVSAAREQLGDALLAVPDGGYYLAAHLRVDADEPALLAAARADGVVLTPGSAFYPRGASPPEGTLFVRLPFQALEPDEFASGVERLARVASSLRAERRSGRGRRGGRLEHAEQLIEAAADRIGIAVGVLQLLAQCVVRGPREHLEAQVGELRLAVSPTPILGQQRHRTLTGRQAMVADSGRLTCHASIMQKRARRGRGANSAIAASHAAVSPVAATSPRRSEPAYRRRS